VAHKQQSFSPSSDVQPNLGNLLDDLTGAVERAESSAATTAVPSMPRTATVPGLSDADKVTEYPSAADQAALPATAEQTGAASALIHGSLSAAPQISGEAKARVALFSVMDTVIARLSAEFAETPSVHNSLIERALIAQELGGAE